jgi:coenzyme PQQ biosynthesis protein PqqD
MAGIDFLYNFIGKFSMSLTIDTVIKKSENIVFRKIEDEYILVPIVSSAADVESIFNLNETGAAVWERIDGKKSIKDIIEEIKAEYENEGNQIENDVISFVREMTEAKLIEA